MKRRAVTDKAAFDLLEETSNLLRAAPASALLAYYVGGIPFVLFLLHHASRLAGGLAGSRGAVSGALWLAVLFLWMKCWQVVFTSRLMACVRRAPADSWTPARAWRMFIQQAALQPLGLVLIPLSALVTVPFAWVHAFFQNVTVLGDGRGAGVTELMALSWNQAKPWPKQNHIGVWLLSPWMLGLGIIVFVLATAILAQLMPYSLLFVIVLTALSSAFLAIGLASPVGFLIAGNVAAFLIFLPWAAHHWFGWRTTFTLAGHHTVLSTTFLFTVFAITYLILDPLMKTFYVLRCFYAESRQSGEDLRVDLRILAARAASTLVLALLLLLVLVPRDALAKKSTPPGPATEAMQVESPRQPVRPGSAGAEPGGMPPEAAPEADDARELSNDGNNGSAGFPTLGIPPDELDRKIDDVLRRPIYQWRLQKPKEEVPEEEKGFLRRFFDGVAETLKEATTWIADRLYELERWLRKLFGWGSRSTGGGANFGGPGPSIWTYLLVFGLIAIALVALVMLYKRWNRAKPAGALAAPVPAAPDLQDENTLASQLPADEWLALARELVARGDFRSALRALFLASLAMLAQQQLLLIARGKSNHDYLRELRRRAHALPAVPELFGEGLRAFERVWYGRDTADAGLVQESERRLDSLREASSSPRGGDLPVPATGHRPESATHPEPPHA